MRSFASVAAIVVVVFVQSEFRSRDARAQSTTAPSASQSPASERGAESSAAVDLQRSRVFIRVDKRGIGHEHGVEGKLTSGSIRLGSSQNAGELVFDMAAMEADTPLSREQVGLAGETDEQTRREVTAEMRGGRVLNVKKYPQARFAISAATRKTAASKEKPAEYAFSGQFTLHGVTRPLSFTATAEPEESQTRIRGQFTILQSQHGIRPLRKALGTIGVEDRLVIHGDIYVGDDSSK